MTDVFDDTPCALGEGPLWHPLRDQLFWFDILNGTLHTREAGRHRAVAFPEFVSCAAWVSDTELLIASESRLILFDVDSERREDVEGLEADNPLTRSNDGRADPWGGFWISSMAKDAANGAGTIYRYYEGSLTPIIQNLTIPNAICFSPDRAFAYYSDTVTGRIMRQPLDAQNGWPNGDADVFLDLTPESLNPDGAVVDQAGHLWNAQWGAWRVACYSPDGGFLTSVPFDAAHTSCPSFGGPGLSTLFCTSARQDLSETDAARSEKHGQTFSAPETGQGQAEHRAVL